ncbi:MAG: capsule biosynthesis protein [Thermodesulfobacteriota bacterium]
MLSGLKKLLSRLVSPAGDTPPAQAADSRYPDWNALFGPDRERFAAMAAQARGGPRILVASGLGGHTAVATLDMLLMAALTVRGAEAHALLCDGCLPACEQLTLATMDDPEGFAAKGIPPRRCRACHEQAGAAYRALGLPVHRYSDFLTEKDRSEAAGLAASVPMADIPGLVRDNTRLGEHALAGALRFFARGTLEEEPLAEPVLRHYLHAALLTAAVTRACLRRYGFRRASFHHGIYIPQGVVGEVCRAEGVDVANWQVAYKKQCFIFSHGDTYHHTMMAEDPATWDRLDWTPALEARTMDYLDSRRRGSNDWIYFHENPSENFAALAADLGLAPSRPMVGLLTNVIWDAQLHYPANAFANMAEWLVATIRHFAGRPELQLVIRVHPAEVNGAIKSRQPACDEIARAFPELPANVKLIGPDKHVSTYAVMERCDAVIIYGTKTGVELTSLGIPVIVAGEAWIRNKGITLDANSREDYEALLRRLPLGRRLDPAIVERARRYAFHFFFRRMIPVASIRPGQGKAPYAVRLAGLDDLLPGKDPGLDVIVDGILHGRPFIYPAEHAGN